MISPIAAALTVAIAACVANVARGGSLRDSIQVALQETALDDGGCEIISDEVCYQILDTWWIDREEQKTAVAINEMDTQCETFSNYPDACNNVKERTADTLGQEMYDGLSEDLKSVACVMIGAKSKRCIGNPCNQFNLGTCTIQETQGQCYWYTDAMVTQVNQFYTDHPEVEPRFIPQHGCYRNPCNLPGEGSTADKCPGLSTDVFQCTYCKGPGDKCLKGKGMGCQLTTPTTTAECAFVNDDNVDQTSVWMLSKQNKCQCSDDYTQCTKTVGSFRPTNGDNTRGPYERKVSI